MVSQDITCMYSVMQCSEISVWQKFQT